ncbi:hypothetical protein AG4045_027608 [Apium graveolens]|uniref:Uncharacterized protein n=1 Tax=Apium graveolens TaxID=4045 RepID=A0A6L5BAK6_APIGR|nr:hypothetical protein AG4045_027608 [Apium graveolens]
MKPSLRNPMIIHNVRSPATRRSSKSLVEDKENVGENRQDWDETSVDNSMTLVAVDIQASTPTTTTTIEPLIAENAGVKDVLDTLRYVKEGLQCSMP